jgi:type II secretory pathway pseudopilin PulG
LRPALGDSEAGFTLIELLVSSLILVSIGAAVAQSLIATAYVSGDQRRHSQAAGIAQQDQERLRGLSVAQLNSLNQVPPRTVNVGGTNYTVTSSSRFLNNTGGPSCQPGAAAYFKIDSSVTWTPNPRGPILVESIIAPPAGGTVRAQVLDQIGGPLQGVSVSASGPDVESAPTDNTGCAVLSGLASGSYAITYAAQGYVDRDGNLSPPNITAQVTSTGNTSPSQDPVTMGLAGTFTGNFKAYAGGAATGAGGEADYLSWYGAGSALSMTGSNSAKSASSLPANTIASTALFPFAFTPTTTPSYANNYQVWAGKCRQMQPPAGINPLSVSPGSTQNVPGVTVAEPELDLFVYNGATRIAPSNVKITFTSLSGTLCSYSWQPTILSTGATTNTKGVLANPGQPFVTSTPNLSASNLTGTMAICADNGSVHKTASSVTDSYTAPTAVSIDLAAGTSSGKCP